MSANEEVRIDVDAIKALTQWKSRLAEGICKRAKLLAAQSGQASRVKLSHFRQAAEVELRSLANAIDCENRADGQEEAA